MNTEDKMVLGSAIVFLLILAMVVLVGVQKPQEEKIQVIHATSTEKTFVYWDKKELPDCTDDDKVVCNFSCAPDGRCIFIPK